MRMGLPWWTNVTLAMVIVPLMQNHLTVSSLGILMKPLTVRVVTVMLGSLT